MTMRTGQPVLRFAPSPNGYLHLGHALSALINFELARRLGGRFLLRIEDADQTRARPHFVDAIFEDLAWLGLAWKEPVRRQSDHIPDYDAALQQLADLGLLYRARLSRADSTTHIRSMEDAGGSWPRDPDGAPLYPGLDKAAEAYPDTIAPWTGRRDHALRLDMTKACQSVGEPLTWQERGEASCHESGKVSAEFGIWGDVLLGGRDRAAAYHLAVVVDDALQGVTHVVRGRDLYWSTSVHRLLQQLLGLPEPVYLHHRLVLDDDGRKLSKSIESTSLKSLRDNGATPQDIRKMVGFTESDLSWDAG